MNTQPKTCPSCNAVNDGDAVFCRCCGKELPKQAQQTPPPYGAYQQPYGTYQQNQQTPPPYGTYQQPYGTYQQNQQTPPPYGAYQQPYGSYQQNQQTPPPYNAEPPADSYEGDIFGTPAKEVAAYVGRRNNRKFMCDFYDRAATGRKAGFNVPVFLLGLLLGPLYMSFWFFYRKCYKIGAVLASVGAVFLIATFVSTIPLIGMTADMLENAAPSLREQCEQYDNNNNGNYKYNYNYNYGSGNSDDYYDKYFGIGDNSYKAKSDTFSINGIELDPEDFGYDSGDIALFYAVTVFVRAASLALAIVCSIFANAWYLKDILRKISEMKQQNPMITTDEISRRGGVAYAAWVTILCAVIVLGIAAIIGIVAVFVSAAAGALV